jgi:hypothetical protein
MIKSFFTRYFYQILCITAISLICPYKTIAHTMDTLTFCSNTCNASQCKTATVKDECKSKCLDEAIWKRIAKAEMDTTSEEFRNEQDEGKKTSMLYGSNIAKCLDLKPTQIVQQNVPEPQPLPAASPASDRITNPRNDLCAAAMAAAREELSLEHEAATNRISEQNIFSIIDNQVGQ